VGYAPDQDLKWDGQNIWPQLTGDVPPKPRSIYVAAPGFNSLALRDGNWKLIAPQSNNKKDIRDDTDAVELYDLATDPYETKNLAATMPARVTELRAKLADVSKADRDALAKEAK
jgi:arylsulfatase A-like enzyme